MKEINANGKCKGDVNEGKSDKDEEEDDRKDDEIEGKMTEMMRRRNIIGSMRKTMAMIRRKIGRMVRMNMSKRMMSRSWTMVTITLSKNMMRTKIRMSMNTRRRLMILMRRMMKEEDNYEKVE